MRVTVGAIAVLGLTVAVATAQPVRERAAVLKAPEPLAPSELPIARGAIDDFPATQLSSTPVTRSGSAVRPAGPAWLTGVDPNVLPAAGTGTKTGGVRPLSSSPVATPKDFGNVPTLPQFFDKFKSALPGDKSAGPQPLPQAPQPPQPTAATPFRGTGANGAPVFAGPPAYRWYGWGSVTPGANPLAPAGQYPKASANWYSITGATPGAFPVPVANPGRMAPGTEPPNYGLAARQPLPVSTVSVTPQPQPAPPVPQYTERPDVPRYNPAAESKFLPGPAVGAAPAPAFAPPSVPVGPPPIPKPAPAGAPVLPPPVPTLPPPSAPAVVAPLVPPAIPVAKPEPVATLPPVTVAPPVVPSVVPSVEPLAPAVEPKPIGTTPSPLPTSVTADPPREEVNWKQSDPATRPGTWAPAPGAAPLPTKPAEPAPSWQSGRAHVPPVVARGQSDNDRSDPIVGVIKQVCATRATGLEVRWTGTKKLSVCFEIRTAESAQRLVADISKRPELLAYQIDFCVLVK